MPDAYEIPPGADPATSSLAKSTALDQAWTIHPTNTITNATRNGRFFSRITVQGSPRVAALEARTTSLEATRLTATQRTAINALNAGTATVADVVNALKA